MVTGEGKVCELRWRAPRTGPDELQPGELVAERFLVERLAGRGGMGAVFRALDLTTDRPVALKVIARRGVAEPHLGHLDAARFLREAELLRRLAHPAIVRYVAHGQLACAAPFLAMEWVDGVDLATHLARQGLRVDESLTLLKQVASALAVAHRAGIVHRDIKPSNLMLVHADVTRLKVLDFGIARSLSASRTLTRESGVLGSVGYMAPEQALGELDVDARADVFALGCLLFECLTGRAAFAARHDIAVLSKVLQDEPPTISTLRPELGGSLDALVSSMLEKDRARRPADAGAVLCALRQLPQLEGNAPVRRAAPKTERAVDSHRPLATVALCASRAPAPDTRQRSSVEPLDELADLTVLIERFGARPLPLRHGALLFVWRPDESCSLIDQARRAVRFAQALNEARPELFVVVTSGAVDLRDDEPTGDAICRATAMLDTTRHPLTMDASTAAFVSLAPSTPCVGRDKELAFLRATLAECQHERAAAMVLLTGPAHVGKTRLVEAFLEPLQQTERAEVLTVRAEPRARRMSLVNTLLGAPHIEASTASLVAWLRARCQHGPVVLVLDDLHWSDEASLSALAFAVHACADCQLLVLGVGRGGDELPALRRLPAQRLSLQALPKRQLARLALLCASHEARLTPAALERVARLSDGDVFVLRELVRALSFFLLELPDSVLTWVQSRLEVFPEDVRCLLRAASLFGEVCTLAQVRAALRDDVDVAACLRFLIEEDVLVPIDELHVRFRHELLREAAHGLLGGQDRAKLGGLSSVSPILLSADNAARKRSARMLGKKK